MNFIRIDVKGWEGFSDFLGTVKFENGVSTRPVTSQEEIRLGASIRIVRVDTNEQVGAATVMAEARNLSAEVETTLSHPSEKPEKQIVLKYSKDRLEEIASEGGIKAIREIGKEFDVKGVEISKMIDDIVKAQLGTKEEV